MAATISVLSVAARPRNRPVLAYDGGMEISVYFTCKHCGLTYEVRQVHLPQQRSGSFDCIECKKPVFEWTGHYDYEDWKPVRMQIVRIGQPLQ